MNYTRFEPAAWGDHVYELVTVANAEKYASELKDTQLWYNGEMHVYEITIHEDGYRMSGFTQAGIRINYPVKASDELVVIRKAVQP